MTRSPLRSSTRPSLAPPSPVAVTSTLSLVAGLRCLLPSLDAARGRPEAKPRVERESAGMLSNPVTRLRSLDPRWFQITVLSSLICYGLTCLHFDLPPAQILVTVGTALAAQLAFTRLAALPRLDAKSAFISSLSLCLLLRTSSLSLAAAAAALAVASKFLVRIRNKHLFNPTNLALAVMLAISPRVWISSGQWGSVAIFSAALALAGLIVVQRSARSDVTLAFGVAYLSLLFGRSLWLGEPLDIPLHRLQSGGLVLFSFFMISDPRTTPDSRTGRVLFAGLVAYGAWYIQFRLFRTNGLIWSLVGASTLTPLLDRLFPGPHFEWTGTARVAERVVTAERTSMKGRTSSTLTARVAITLLGLLLAHPSGARAFCGFYVAKADTKLFNRASQLVLVRDEDRTVMTLSNDFQGDPKEFAMVVPVPTAIRREQIHIGDRAVIDHLDAYTAPRLVEYFDADPCAVGRELDEMKKDALMAPAPASGALRQERAKSLGVHIEAEYTVGEYDIVILSAEQSSGLETWLRESGYRIPDGASDVLGTYLKQKMKFFVAKVNLAEQARLGFRYLRPISVAYESPKFMLPIRLGMVNANGPQELFVYALTRKGRVETTNYRTVRLPSGMNVPEYVKADFGPFYQAMFTQQVKDQNMNAVFLEYAWDMSWCDPCAADPLAPRELRDLGVFWIGGNEASQPSAFVRPQPTSPNGGARDVFVTRLHVRYDDAHFPEDLVFQATGDRENFQGRYVLQHPYTGALACDAGRRYRETVWERQGEEAKTLASLTGWDLTEIRRKIGLGNRPYLPAESPWYERLWSND